MEFKLDQVISLVDLMKKLSLGAIPIWLSLTLPTIYLVYSKLLKTAFESDEQREITILQKLKRVLSIPKMDEYVIYASLFFFVLGTITLYLEKESSENIRKDGLRLKEYLMLNNNYCSTKSSLANNLFKSNQNRINKILKQYPNEFIEESKETIILVDSISFQKILNSSVNLLDSYLSDSIQVKRKLAISYLKLSKVSDLFTKTVMFKLIEDSTNKYSFSKLDCGIDGILVK